MAVVESIEYINALSLNASSVALMSDRWLFASLFVLAIAPVAAHGQVSTGLPPQTIGTLPSDKELPTELEQVQRLLATGHPQQALDRADAQLAKNPRDAQMRFVRGVILTEMKRTSEAREAFQKLTEDFPELPEPYNNLAVLYANEGRLDSAKAALEMALTASPNYGTALENLGDIYLQMAADSYQRAMKADPANRQASAKLALARELIVKSRNVR